MSATWLSKSEFEGTTVSVKMHPGAWLVPEKMKILRVITRLNVGGPSCHVRLVMENLDSYKFEQRMIVGKVSSGEIEDGSAAIHADVRLPSLKRPLSLAGDISARRGLKEVIDSYQPDLIHTHQAKAGFLVSQLKPLKPAKLVHTYHGHTFAGYWGPIMSRVVVAAERRAASRRDLILAQSDSQIEEIVAVLGEEVRPKMKLVPPAIDLGRLLQPDQKPSKVRHDLGLTREKILVFLGRLTAIKNPELFLRVLARVRELSREPVVALMVGGGSIGDENQLHDLVDELDLRSAVRWLGYRNDVGAILSLADVCVSTSINEGTPLSLLEAVFSGARVAAFDVGGIADILGSKAGVSIVEPRDEEALAQAIHAHIVHGPLPETLIAKNRGEIEGEFGVDRLVDDLGVVYQELLGQ